jgi:hypothetical protein
MATAHQCVTRVEGLARHLRGDLSPMAMEYHPFDPFPVFVDGTSRTSLNGVRQSYITPFADALFTGNMNLLEDILIDATFKIIRRCVASILMICIANVEVPVVLSSARAISLERYHVVCDQGTALHSVYDAHHNARLVCLSHLLVSLKTRSFTDEVGNLVRYRVAADFGPLGAVCASIFAALAALRVCQLKESFAKVDLAFLEGYIVVGNPAY